MCGMNMSTEVENYQRLMELMTNEHASPDLVNAKLDEEPYNIDKMISKLSHANNPHNVDISSGYLLGIFSVTDKKNPAHTPKKYELENNTLFQKAVREIFWREVITSNNNSQKFGPREILFIDESNEQNIEYKHNIFRVYFLCNDYPFNQEVMDRITEEADIIICLSNHYVEQIRDAADKNLLKCGVYMPYFKVENRRYDMQRLEYSIMLKFAKLEEFWDNKRPKFKENGVIKDEEKDKEKIPNHLVKALRANLCLINSQYFDSLREHMDSQYDEYCSKRRTTGTIEYLKDIKSRSSESETKKCEICTTNRERFSMFLNETMYSLSRKEKFPIEINEKLWNGGDYEKEGNRQTLYGVYKQNPKKYAIEKSYGVLISDENFLHLWTEESSLGNVLPNMKTMSKFYQKFKQTGQWTKCDKGCNSIDSNIEAWILVHEYDTFIAIDDSSIVPYFDLSEKLFWKDSHDPHVKKLDDYIIENNNFRIECRINEVVRNTDGGTYQ